MAYIKNNQISDIDFTVESYKELLRLALKSYAIVNYQKIPWGKRFILWRHDCDFSLNRALALARIEASIGVKATYFINPHSEYYNLNEYGQIKLLNEIIKLGHYIGLHFDANFHEIKIEDDLHSHIANEADNIEQLLGVRPAVFSFHNPSASHLSCESDSYGGLINCYSLRFKSEVPYCSDSNGYWRFRRLHDVLSEAKEPCLQVLTHPDWWQETPMPPRQRIFRSVFGRANAAMHLYDQTLAVAGRKNLLGNCQYIQFLKPISPALFSLFDYLWNSEQYPTIYVELWRLHERQINKLCKAELRKQWRVPAFEINAFFESPSLAIDGWRLFAGVFGKTWQDAVGLEESEYRAWVELRNTLILGRASVPRQRLEEGCVFLCSAIQSLAEWGKSEPIHYDGIADLGSAGIPTYTTADGSLNDRLEELADEIENSPIKKWEQFKAYIPNIGAGGTALGAAQ